MVRQNQPPNIAYDLRHFILKFLRTNRVPNLFSEAYLPKDPTPTAPDQEPTTNTNPVTPAPPKTKFTPKEELQNKKRKYTADK